jgi:hypothetical protein
MAVDLTACPACKGTLVQPVEWSTIGETHWYAKLRCPDCELLRNVVFDNATAERYDRQLDQGTAVLLIGYRELDWVFMLDEVEVFAEALRTDAVLPEDF